MSVREELMAFKQERGILQKEFQEASSALAKLEAQREPLIQKVEELRSRKSSLAQTVLEKTQAELDKLNQTILKAKERKDKAEEAFEENQRKISEREDEPDLYIQEQADLMIISFLEYMRIHLEEIAFEIKKTYSIREVTRYQEDRYYGCDIPTGNIGIYDKSAECFITTSSDFYFPKKLYILRRGEFDALECITSELYKTYCSKFKSVLLETLKKNYNYSEFFSLTIDDSGFTLELV